MPPDLSPWCSHSRLGKQNLPFITHLNSRPFRCLSLLVSLNSNFGWITSVSYYFLCKEQQKFKASHALEHHDCRPREPLGFLAVWRSDTPDIQPTVPFHCHHCSLAWDEELWMVQTLAPHLAALCLTYLTCVLRASTKLFPVQIKVDSNSLSSFFPALP